MITKKCCRCKKEKPVCDFYSASGRKDGLQTMCIECAKEYRKEHMKTADGMRVKRTYQREYQKSSAGKKAKKKFLSSEKGKELTKRYRLKNIIKNIIKNKARKKLNKEIKAGTMIRKPCEICGSNERIQAHHKDYDKPLDVEWFCEKCHKKVHSCANYWDNIYYKVFDK